MRSRGALWYKANDQAALVPRLIGVNFAFRRARLKFLFSDANADMWTAGFVSIRMTNLDDVRLRTA